MVSEATVQAEAAIEKGIQTALSTTPQTIEQALLLAQGEFPEIPKDKENKHYNQRYASLDSIVSTTRPALVKHGLLCNHRLEDTSDGLRVTAVLRHIASQGELINSLTCVCPRTNPQTLGSMITYLRRYTISSLLGITPDEDDDGHAAAEEAKSAPPKRTYAERPSAPPTKPAPPQKAASPEDSPEKMAEARGRIALLDLEKVLALVNTASTVGLINLIVDGVAEGPVYQVLPEWEQVIVEIRKRYGELVTAGTIQRQTDFETKMKTHREKLELDKQGMETFSPSATEAPQA